MARFVAHVMEGIPPKPAAFETIVGKNRGTIPLVAAKPRPYGAREAWEAVRRGALVVDAREPAAFGEAHVPGALNVWIESPQFAERVAMFTPAGTPVLLMVPGPSDLERAVLSLSRVGVDEVAGYLQWGLIEWRSEELPVETVDQVSVHDLAQWLEEQRDVVVVDVREPAEWADGHIPGAVALPMSEAGARWRELPADRPKAVLCAGGLRSSTVISALKRHGVGGWHNVTGGMTAWARAGGALDRPPTAR